MGFRSIIRTMLGRVHGLDVSWVPVWNKKDGTQLVVDTDGSGNPYLETTTVSGVTRTFQVQGANRTKLTATSTVQATDDGTIFWSTGAVTLNLPSGLSPMPVFMVDPPAAGSITVTPTGSAMLAGSTNPYAINRANTPAGAAAVTPYLDTSDQYGVTVAGTAFASLTGNSTDNSSLAASLAALSPLPPGGNKLSAGYTLSTADYGGFIWLNAQAADKTISVGATLATSVPFHCYIGYLNSGAVAGRAKLATAGGSAFNWTNTIAGSTLAGTLQTSAVYMGGASFNNMAACMVVSEGSAPGGAFFVIPICGTFSTV